MSCDVTRERGGEGKRFLMRYGSKELQYGKFFEFLLYLIGVIGAKLGC